MLSTDKARSRIRTIALVARKGGSGKSTIATALAVAHELAGGRAVVLRRQPVGGHLIARLSPYAGAAKTLRTLGPYGTIVPMGALHTLGTCSTFGPLMGDTHRVAIAPELFHEARRYMVEHDLPTVRSAVEAMIEAQSCKEPGAPVIAKTQEVEHCENGEAAKTKEEEE